MTTLPALTDTENYGPAMQALTPQARRFVIALLESGSGNLTDAARAAGYSIDSNIRSSASRLAHNPKVQKAIQEEARSRFNSSTIVGANTVVEIALHGSSEASRLKAAGMLLNRGGLPEVLRTENIHEHNMTLTVEQARRRIAALVEKDPELKALIPPEMITDVEFKEVTTVGDGREGLEDLL